MLKNVENGKGKCFEFMKVINQNWHSTYFIYHKRTFKNGKITFVVDYDSGPQTWSNYDFLEFNINDKWYCYS